MCDVDELNRFSDQGFACHSTSQEEKWQARRGALLPSKKKEEEGEKPEPAKE